MQLLDEIVDLLSTQKGSLTDAILKTKVLLHKIGHGELAEWADHELHGYPDPDKLPSYRKLPAEVRANIMNRGYSYTSHPIPLHLLSEKQRADLEIANIADSLAVLEARTAGERGMLITQFPMEWNALLSKGLGGGFLVQRAWGQIDAAAIKGIFIQVRSRLLGFVLNLQGKLGDATTDQEVKAKASTFDASRLFNNSVFSGQTTIIVGANNTQHVVNNVTKGDFQALASELMKLGLQQVDIDELKQAMADDAQTVQMKQQRFGPAINAWISRMFSKAANAAWQIELNIVAGVLTTKLQQFYGWLTQTPSPLPHSLPIRSIDAIFGTLVLH